MPYQSKFGYSGTRSKLDEEDQSPYLRSKQRGSAVEGHRLQPHRLVVQRFAAPASSSGTSFWPTHHHLQDAAASAAGRRRPAYGSVRLNWVRRARLEGDGAEGRGAEAQVPERSNAGWLRLAVQRRRPAAEAVKALGSLGGGPVRCDPDKLTEVRRSGERLSEVRNRAEPDINETRGLFDWQFCLCVF